MAESKQTKKLIELTGILYKRGYTKSLIGSVTGRSYDCVNRMLCDAKCGYSSYKGKANPNKFNPLPMNSLTKKLVEALVLAEAPKTHVVSIKFNQANFEKQKQLAINKLKSKQSL